MINNQTTLLLGKNYIQADKFATGLLNQKTKEIEKNYKNPEVGFQLQIGYFPEKI